MQNGPEGVRPNGIITWTSDDHTEWSGWELCAQEDPSDDGNPATTGTSDEAGGLSGGTMGIIAGSVVGGLVVVGCIVAVVLYFLMFKKASGRIESSPAPSTSSSVAPKPETIGPQDLEKEEHSYSNEAPAQSVQELMKKEVPAEALQTPRYWINKDLSLTFVEQEPVSDAVAVAIQQCMDATYKEVSTKDRKGGQDAMPKGFKVVNVFRVENRDLWKMYATGRHAMRQKRKHKCTPVDSRGPILCAAELADLEPELDSSINETLMFHGTSPSAAAAITKEGFKLSYAGENAGSMYGKGLYFAECSSKSDEYAGADNTGMYKGLYCLLICRVVLGEQLVMAVGGAASHNMITEALNSQLYDSVMGDRLAAVGTYREFVVYEDKLVYPEYLVIYKRLTS
jgi:hypothetical protein